MGGKEKEGRGAPNGLKLLIAIALASGSAADHTLLIRKVPGSFPVCTLSFPPPPPLPILPFFNF